MKSPVDVIIGRIVGYDERTGELTIKANYPDWRTALKREYKKCRIQLIDGRPLSGRQRNVCYKLLREIADYTGNGLDRTKEEMKRKFVEEEMYDSLDDGFSLSDAPMSTVCAFQRFLVRFMLDYDIPARFSLLDFVDDAHDYLYSCLARKKCCICGKPADLHHIDHVGTGRNRDDIIHEGMEAISLCRAHHNEDHLLGERTFLRKYHIGKGIELDKNLCRIYELKRKEDAKNAQYNNNTGEADERSGASQNAV